jgi:hypothetical protein
MVTFLPLVIEEMAPTSWAHCPPGALGHPAGPAEAGVHVGPSGHCASITPVDGDATLREVKESTQRSGHERIPARRRPRRARHRPGPGQIDSERHLAVVRDGEGDPSGVVTARTSCDGCSLYFDRQQLLRVDERRTRGWLLDEPRPGRPAGTGQRGLQSRGHNTLWNRSIPGKSRLLDFCAPPHEARVAPRVLPWTDKRTSMAAG